MQPSRGVHQAALVLTMFLLTCPLAASGAPPQREIGTAAQLEARLDSLREENRFAEAADAAEELLALRAEDPASPPHEIVDLEWELRTLRILAADPEAARSHVALVDSLWGLVRGHWRAGRYAEGLQLAERRAEELRGALGGQHPELAAALSSLASLHRAQGHYAEADSLYRHALALREMLLGPEHPAVGRTLNGLAALLYSNADYANAERLYRRALSIQRAALGDESPHVARTLNNLAVLQEAVGDYRGAEVGYREALQIRRAAYGDRHRDVATGLNNLAGALLKQGDFVAAESLYREALALRRELLGNEHPGVAASLNNLAMLLKEQGDFLRAEPLHRESLAICRAAYGGEHPVVAKAMNNLALALQGTGDYAGAEPLLREALAMRKKLLGETHPDVANGLSSLAKNLQLGGAHAEAESLFGEALAIRRVQLGEENPDVARLLGRMAELHRVQDQDAKAEALYAQALSIRERELGGQHPELAANLRQLGRARLRLGETASAESLLVRAASAYDAARLRAGREFTRSTFTYSPYADLAAARLLLGENDAAWPAAEKALARSLSDLLLSAGGRGLSAAEAAREDSLKGKLGDLERNLVALQRAARDERTDPSRTRAEEARNELLAAEAAWSVLQAELAAAHPVSEGQIYSLARVQKTLDEETAIVGWLDVGLRKAEYLSWGYVLRPRGPVFWAPLGGRGAGEPSSSPHPAARAYRRGLADPASSAIGNTRAGRELWRQRIEPLSEALANVENLIVIPSGAMLGMPLETLVSAEGERLGERFAVSYAPSATLHAWLAESSAARSPRAGDVGANELRSARRSLLVGDPPFAAKMPQLAGAGEELEAIAAVSPGAFTLAGADASEQALARLARADSLALFASIHFATHALIDDELPEHSALVLSQADLPDPVAAAMAGERVYDGLLSASEIVREWEIDADLVTLSACATGLGKEVGGEGYLGLANAFLRAGARSLVVSLWPVEDRATALLMARFHENYRGAYEGERGGVPPGAMTKASALREAKAWLRAYDSEGGRAPYAHPYYWSAFILIGDPGAAR